MRLFLDAVWVKLQVWGNWLKLKVLTPGVALLIVVLALLLVAMGWKELQIGGLLARLFGKKQPPSTVGVANTVPPDRVDSNGNLIPVGTPDATGQTQVAVVPIEPPGLFSNPNTVKFTPPKSDIPVEVTLPTGVKNTDVKQVVVIQPQTVVVTVKDRSGITTQNVDDLLKRYGG